MIQSLPETAQEFMQLSWPQIEPYYQSLIERPLDASNVQAWLADWSRLYELQDETFQRLYVAVTVNTADEDAEKRYNHYLDQIFPQSQAANQKVKQKLLASGLEPDGFEIPLRNMRTEAMLFNDANLPLLSEEMKLANEYDKIIGAQTVEWEGRELTPQQLEPMWMDLNREVREKSWRMVYARRLQDRQAINELWQKLMGVRIKLAANAGYPDYRAYRWKQMLRFDYTPEDCFTFHRAIEEVVVPAVARLNEKRRQRLGLNTLRPWDQEVDEWGLAPLKPFESVSELESGISNIFHQVDPELGQYFEVMRQKDLLDLDNRKSKAPGGYCTTFSAVRLPFIFANAVGIQDDVQTLLHEGGHSFHVFESARLPSIFQLQVGNEFAEVASMGMELLASPYLTRDQGGFYSPKDAARARIEWLDRMIKFWPYMAVVDAFQHWVYENPQQGRDPERCDARWAELWQRFMPGVDYSGLEAEMMTGWHHKPHIHQTPFYYVEYGLALLGAVQVWNNALQDQAGAVASYRKALSKGGTGTLPQLFSLAGAKFAFDPNTLDSAVQLMESTIEKLETQIAN